jgi:hypothetical protein
VRLARDRQSARPRMRGADVGVPEAPGVSVGDLPGGEVVSSPTVF